MKKLISIALALTICAGFSSCGSENTEELSEVIEETVIETEPPTEAPEYNTFGKTLDDIVNALNNSGEYTITFSSDCTTEDAGDGKTKFSTNDVIAGCYLSGFYETATKNIINIMIKYPCESSDDISVFVAEVSASTIMAQLFGVDSDTMMSKWEDASNSSDGSTDYAGHSIGVIYDEGLGGIITMVIPENELK